MTQVHTDQLAISTSLATKTKQLCLGLESGAADILELVTPITLWRALQRTPRCERWPLICGPCWALT